MIKTLAILLALLTGSICMAFVTKAEIWADFYVSPAGNDDWTGTLADPGINGNDGPFATLERARNAVRTLKKSRSGDVVVLIRGGVYHLDKTLVFGLEDSGDPGTKITYAAYPGETPVFSSGWKIDGWRKVTGKLQGLPEEAEGNILVAEVYDRFLTLYDNKGMLPRAQSDRFVPLQGGTKRELRFPQGRLKNWPNVEDVEIVIRPTRDWTMNILPLVSVDEDAGIARTAIEASYGMSRRGCWVENVLEELDEPGEWVLNTREGKVYLWPRGKSPVFAPRLLELIRIEGKIDKEGPTDVPVRNLRFRGLTFKHGERYTLSPDDAGLQHDWDMLDKDNALVRLRGTENCSIEDCHFLHSGSGAIRVDLHGMHNEISGNHIEHMGGGGILLCGYGPGTKDVNKGNFVYNNHIHHVSELYWHSPGIFLWQSGENRVANNLIYETNYTGLIVSGCVLRFFATPDMREQVRTIRWHEIGDLPEELTQEVVRPYMHSRNNLIENNEIHHVMKKLGDGNGIYIRAAGPGNVIRRNFVHHLISETPKQGAIRTDGGQMDALIAENLIWKCKSQGMTLKLNNRFENNIIADVIVPRGTYLKIVEGPMQGASNKRNIYYSSLDNCTFISEPGGGSGRVGEDRRGRLPARMKDIDSDHNIYYCKADNSLGEKILHKLQGDGVDPNSQAVDPLFVDPDNGDFRFRPESPAQDLGIIPIDLSGVGLVSSEQVKPTWESMSENYQVPNWFLDGKIGVWFHWGIPSSTGEDRPNDGSWYGRNMYGGESKRSRELSAWHTENYGPPEEFGYEKLIPLFKAENWDPDSLVRFVKENGARFVMPVACHHDNFDLYDSFHPWNSVDMGPRRDVLGEWKNAAYRHGLKFGISTHLYWSPGWWKPARKYQKEGTLEWKLFNMDFDQDNYSSQDSWNEHWYARCWEIIDKYDPDMFNNDSPYPRIGSGKGLGIKLFSSYLNRDLTENNGEQSVVLSLKDGKADRSAFTYNLERGGAGEIKPDPWIWATDLSGNWFYRKNAVNRMSVPVMVANAVDAISKNGVAMLNVALKGDGTIPENQIAYLTAFGDFLKINGEGIYGTRPWKVFGEGPLEVKDGRQGENHADYSQADIRFTTKEGILYVFVLAPPSGDIVIKTLAAGGVLDGQIEKIELMGSSEKIKWERAADGLTIKLPKVLPGSIVNGFKLTTASQSYSQDRLIKGWITTLDSIPLSDVTIIVKNTKEELRSDSLGSFSFKSTYPVKIRVKASGFISETVKLEKGEKIVLINLRLSSAENSLERATSHGHIKDPELFKEIASSKAEKDYTNYRDVFEIIRNSSSGITIQGDDIIIGGKKSFGSDAALVILDGIPVPSASVKGLNPITIKSVNVLKGPAAAIYGVRGANGVIEIETKRGLD